MTRRRRPPIPRDAILLAVAFFFAIAAGNVLTPLLPDVQRDFGVSLTAAGLLVSSFNIARLALDLPAGLLAERLGVTRLATIGFGVLILGGLLAGINLGSSFAPVLVGRICMGLGCSILSLVVLTTLSNMAPAGARASVLALYPMANNTAIALFPLVGAAFGRLWGWRSTMILCAGLACLSAFLVRPILRRYTVLHTTSGAAPAGPAFRFTGLTILGMGIICFGALANMLNRHGFRNTALPLFASHQLGLDSVQIATGVSVVALTGLVVAIPGGALADRWSQRGVICLGLAVLAIGDLTFLHANSYVTFLLSAFILGSGDFFSSSQTAVLTENLPPALRSRAVAVYRFSVDLGAAVGPVLLASLLQFAGLQVMVFVAAGVLLFASAGGALTTLTLRLKPVTNQAQALPSAGGEAQPASHP
ncbi:MAG: MFS transporter [Chloroflexota bacterium]